MRLARGTDHRPRLIPLELGQTLVALPARDPGHEPFSFEGFDKPGICNAKGKSQPALRFLEPKARE